MMFYCDFFHTHTAHVSARAVPLHILSYISADSNTQYNTCVRPSVRPSVSRLPGECSCKRTASPSSSRSVEIKNQSMLLKFYNLVYPYAARCAANEI